MIKNIISRTLCAFLAAASLPLAAANVEYKTRTLDEKLAEPGVRFFASFDKRHINSDVAKGYTKALSNSGISLDLRGAMGFDNNPAYIPSAEEELAYMLKNNLDIKNGALSFWFRCDEFDPADANLKKNIGIFNVEIPLKNGLYNTFAYFFAGQFYIQSRFFDKQGKSIGIPVSVKVPGSKFGKGVWNQIAWSFDKENRQQFFLNGEPLNRLTLLVIPPEITDFEVNKRSYMAFSCRVWTVFTGQIRPHVVALDDIIVYDQALPEAAVQAKYQSLLKNRTKDVKLLVLDIDGKERGIDKVPLLRCNVDARAMTGAPKSASYTLKKGDKIIKKGSIKLEQGVGSELFDVPAEPQNYIFEVTCGKITEKLSFKTPDFTFIGKFPRRDVVLPPWTTPVYNVQENSYKVWNRKYYFGKGPFPVKIVTDSNINILDKAPELYMDDKPVVWQTSQVKTGKSYIIFSGSGKGKNNSRISYTTRLDFDGVMKTDFTINDQVEVNSMTLRWQAGKDLRKYLMTPNYQAPTPNRKYSFQYPRGNIFRTPCMLWSVSNKAGFCWMPEDDGNWVHSNKNDAFNMDLNTGEAVVKIIAKKSVIPAGASYNSWFAATPTRPAPEHKRGVYGRNTIHNWFGNRHNASWETDPMLEDSYIRVFAKKSFAPYGMGHGQVLSNPMAKYMEKDWDAPGCFIYGMACRNVDEKNKLYEHYLKTFRIANSNPCPNVNTLFNEWQVYQAYKLMTSKYADRVAMLYYDLGAPCFFCGNEIHGCAYIDKFGRKITPMQITGFRDQYIRLLDLARKYDVEIMSHAQDQFVPFVNGITDWWLPGEQCSGILRADKYAFVNKLRPYYDTEMNRDVLGCGVLFYTHSIGAAGRELVRTSTTTEMLMAMLMLYDIEWNKSTEHTGFNFRVWNTYMHYGMHDKSVKVHRFDTQKEITFDNPVIEATWYECPGNYKLAVIVNSTDKAQTVTVDISKLQRDGVIYDEYRNKPYELKNGKFTATIQPRNFILCGLPAKGWFPFKDGFSQPWHRVLSNRLSAVGTQQIAIPTNDFGIFRTAAPALGAWPIHGDFAGINGEAGSNFSPAKFIPVRTKNAMTATVYCRSRNAAAKTNVYMKIVVLDANNQPIGKEYLVSATGKHASDWEKLQIKLPANSNAAWLHVILHASAGGRDGIVVFDDFTLE